MGIQTLELKHITLDERLQMRVEMSKETIEEYAEHLDKLPPLTVILDEDGKYLLVDGWHTYEAHKLNKAKTVRCDVTTGTWVTALFAAAGANQKHGLRRTNADKRKAVQMLLQISEEEGHDWTQAAIAANTHTSQQFVSKLAVERREATQNASTPDHTTVVSGDNSTPQSPANGKAKPLDLRCTNCKRKHCHQEDTCEGCKRRKAEYIANKGKPRGGNSAGSPPKQGAEVFSLRSFNEHLSRALAEVDKLAHEYAQVNGRGQPQSIEQKGIERQIAAVRDSLEAWYKQLKKQGKPGF